MGCIVGMGIMRQIDKIQDKIEAIKAIQATEEILLQIAQMEIEIISLQWEALDHFR